MSTKFNIAIAGATGNVGREIIQILEDKEFPVDHLYLLASSRSKGQAIEFRGEELIVEDLAEFDFSKVQIGLFSPGGKVSAEFAPKAAKAGCLVIDNSSHFRMHDNVPLIVPEVNASALEDFFNNNDRSNIIANPNCSTIQMLVALKPIHDEFIIQRIDVTTLQAVSGTGKEATEELLQQIGSYEGKKQQDSIIYPKQIANNVLPHCDVFEENRYTKEENKLLKETHKILDPNIQVAATCVRVPVLNGHSESIHIQTKKPLTEDSVVNILQNAPGLKLHYGSDAEDYPTAATDADGDYFVHVGRLRKDLWSDNRINMWVVADNLLKGAALNSIQIAELIFE